MLHGGRSRAHETGTAFRNGAELTRTSLGAPSPLFAGNATVIAPVFVSPVSRASWLASRHVSSFLMFGPIVSPG